jgi:glutamine amidotransferase
MQRLGDGGAGDTTMCRWLTYSGEPIYLDSVILEPENSLIRQSLHAQKTHVTTNGDGFGLGWYGERDEPGVYRDILPAWNDANLKSLSHQIRSNLFFAHVRASTGTATSRTNCHPFSYGRWMFMHNGQIGGYDRVRRKLEAQVPDNLYLSRQGTTDSELFFLLMFHFGLEQDPVTAFERTARCVLDTMREASVDQAFRMTAALTDGRRIYAVRFSTDPEPPTLYWQLHQKHIMVVSEPLDTGSEGWTTVPAAHIVIAEGMRLRVQPFGV